MIFVKPIVCCGRIFPSIYLKTYQALCKLQPPTIHYAYQPAPLLATDSFGLNGNFHLKSRGSTASDLTKQLVQIVEFAIQKAFILSI